MKLEQEILIRLLSNYDMQITFPNLKLSARELVEREALHTLFKICEVLKDDNLEDAECFYRIEKIVSLLEGLGLECGNRHDWG